jgi:hypothetical protein
LITVVPTNALLSDFIPAANGTRWYRVAQSGVSPTRLMAVTSYVGNGAGSRDISLNLSGNRRS